jgi:hypothetical protein
MPDDTDILGLPLILPNQAQKHVTHNEALAALDVIVQLAVIARTETVPPVLAVPGDRYIVPAGATLDWAGQAGKVAVLTEAGWQFYSPNPGWRAHVMAEGLTAVFDGVAWKTAAEGAGVFAEVGVSATPDATNRLSVSAPATLLNHAGAGHQLKLNKAAETDTASLLFQTGFSGRAEMGTTGSDEFAIRTSANGSGFVTGVRVTPAGVFLELPVGGAGVTQSTTDTTMGRLMRVGDFGLGASSAQDHADWNTATINGAVYDANSAANAPIATGWFIGTYHRMTSIYGVQKVTGVTGAGTGRSFERRLDAGTWSPWREMFGQGNVLGSVSQSSGVPTGALIERGSNANGDYVRFADGTQICTRTNLSAANASTALGGLFRSSSNVTWTYPASFAASPAVSGDVDDADCWMVTAGAPGTATAALRVLSAVSKATALAFRAIAVGRWF